MGNVLGLDHVSILVKDADRSVQFYCNLLGLEILPRPDLGFPGYWLGLGAGQSLHIMQLDNPNEGTLRPEHGGRDYHFAVRVASIESLKRRFESEGVAYTQSRSGRKALFVRDPDENAFELFEYQG